MGRVSSIQVKLVPEQHTVAPNMKFLVSGLAYVAPTLALQNNAQLAIVLLVIANFIILRAFNFDTSSYSQISPKLGQFHIN